MINFRLVRHLWSFLAVAEEGHFGRAAARLGMSQPPLTEQIQVLEQALKIQLFTRGRHGAQLTPAGQAILPAVRKFAGQVGQLELAVREAAAGQSGLLTIGAITSAMLEIVPPFLDRFRMLHPGLTIAVREIDSAEAVPALVAGDIDLAFARLQGQLGSSLEIMTLARDRLFVALPAGHRLAGKTRLRMKELADEPFVMFERRLSPVYFDSVVAACRASDFSPRILHDVRSVAAQVAFVGCGQGIALVPSSTRKLAPETVMLRPLVEEVEIVTTAAAWSSTSVNPAVQSAVVVLRSISDGVGSVRGKRASRRLGRG